MSCRRSRAHRTGSRGTARHRVHEHVVAGLDERGTDLVSVQGTVAADGDARGSFGDEVDGHTLHAVELAYLLTDGVRAVLAGQSVGVVRRLHGFLLVVVVSSVLV